MKMESRRPGVNWNEMKWTCMEDMNMWLYVEWLENINVNNNNEFSLTLGFGFGFGLSLFSSIRASDNAAADDNAGDAGRLDL